MIRVCSSTILRRNRAVRALQGTLSHLARYGVRLADLVSPVAPTHWDDGQLGKDDGSADGGRHLFGALDAQTHVAIEVADGHERLEARALSGTCLLLHRHDLEHFVLKRATQEVVDDLVLLDGVREGIDVLEGLDLPVLDQAPEFGDGHPLLLAFLTAATTATTAASTAPTTAATPTKTATETTSSSGWSCVRHAAERNTCQSHLHSVAA